MRHLLPVRARRRGASFLEILIAVGLLAGALVPIGSMLVGTAGQTAATKAEAQAANFAATVMNRFLDNEKFDDVTDGLTGEEAMPDNSVTVSWTLNVTDISNTAITPRHRLVKYHRPTLAPDCTTGGEAKITALDANNSELVNGPGSSRTKTVAELDQKNASQVVFKELRLTVKWKTAKEPAYEADGDPRNLKRTVVLITRRARL